MLYESKAEAYETSHAARIRYDELEVPLRTMDRMNYDQKILAVAGTKPELKTKKDDKNRINCIQD